MTDKIAKGRPVLLAWELEDGDMAVIYVYRCSSCGPVISSYILGDDAKCPLHNSELAHVTRVNVEDISLTTPNVLGVES